MLLNLNDPESIVAWWKVLPDQHAAYLDHKLKVSPEFAPAINAAQARIASEPQLRSLLVQCVQRRRQSRSNLDEHTADAIASDSRLHVTATV